MDYFAQETVVGVQAKKLWRDKIETIRFSMPDCGIVRIQSTV